jgi:hypothetical protein
MYILGNFLCSYSTFLVALPPAFLEWWPHLPLLPQQHKYLGPNPVTLLKLLSSHQIRCPFSQSFWFSCGIELFNTQNFFLTFEFSFFLSVYFFYVRFPPTLKLPFLLLKYGAIQSFVFILFFFPWQLHSYFYGFIVIPDVFQSCDLYMSSFSTVCGQFLQDSSLFPSSGALGRCG